MDTYHHTQKAPWHVLLCALATALLTAGWFTRPEPVLNVLFSASGLLMLLLGASFHHLTVEDEGHQLVLRFGLLPLFGKRRIWYDDICGVERGRTTFLDGWGIQWSPWSGWVWNIWGYDCVVLRLKRSILRVGTDDPQGLAEFLKSRIAAAS